MRLEAGIWDAAPNDIIRIVVRYGDKLRPILWFKVGKDGSVYFGPRLTRITVMRTGSMKSQDGQLRINYLDGEDIDLSTVAHPTKVSYHRSGEIHSPGETAFGPALNGIAKQLRLCLMLFMHPSEYSSVESYRSKDVVLDYPFDETRPLTGSIYVCPAANGKQHLSPIANATNQLTMLFNYSGLKMSPSHVQIQVTLWHGLEGFWPPTTVTLYSHSPINT